MIWKLFYLSLPHPVPNLHRPQSNSQLCRQVQLLPYSLDGKQAQGTNTLWISNYDEERHSFYLFARFYSYILQSMTGEIRREPVQILMANFLIPTRKDKRTYLIANLLNQPRDFGVSLTRTFFNEIWFDRKVACLGEVMSAPFRGHTLVTQRRYYSADKI